MLRTLKTALATTSFVVVSAGIALAQANGGPPNGGPPNAGGNPPPVRQSLIQRLDTNHDNAVDFDEYFAPQKQRFDQLDTNHDGTLAGAELDGSRLGRDRTLRVYDANNDGSVSLAEFQAVIKAEFDRLDQDKNGKLTEQARTGPGQGPAAGNTPPPGPNAGNAPAPGPNAQNDGRRFRGPGFGRGPNGGNGPGPNAQGGPANPPQAGQNNAPNAGPGNGDGRRFADRGPEYREGFRDGMRAEWQRFMRQWMERHGSGMRFHGNGPDGRGNGPGFAPRGYDNRGYGPGPNMGPRGYDNRGYGPGPGMGPRGYDNRGNGPGPNMGPRGYDNRGNGPNNGQRFNGPNNGPQNGPNDGRRRFDDRRYDPRYDNRGGNGGPTDYQPNQTAPMPTNA